MIELSNMWEVLNQYPTCIPFYLFIIAFILLLVSFVTGLDSDIDFSMDVAFVDDILVSAGVSKVPLVIGLTCTFLPMTIISYFLQEPLFNTARALMPDIIYYIIFAGVSFVLFVGCLYIGGFLSKPIAVFMEKNMSYEVDYIFQSAEVITTKVSSTYGEVKLDINSSEHTLKVYTEEDDVVKGDTVIILSYDEDTDKYLVKKA